MWFYFQAQQLKRTEKLKTNEKVMILICFMMQFNESWMLLLMLKVINIGKTKQAN